MAEYKDFKIKDIFVVQNVAKAFAANSITIYNTRVENSYPYVVRKTTENGIRGYIIADKHYLNKGNCISFAMDTFKAYYQQQDFFSGGRIKCFRLKDHELNLNTALYLITCINKIFSTATWGAPLDNDRVINKEINLPIDSEGNPNWEYMENYIENAKKKYLKLYTEEANRKIQKLQEFVGD